MRKKAFGAAVTALLLAACLCAAAFAANDIADGVYTAEAVLTGGSGRAAVESPAQITVREGKITARVVWSSPNYTYMEIGGVRYFPVQTEGNAAFDIPAALDEEIAVSAETVAMSAPHVIDYTLRFEGATLKSAEPARKSAPAPAAIAAVAVIAAAVVAVFFVFYGKKKGRAS